MRARRFRVASLENASVGGVVALPADEAKHARVLRLKDGAPVEVFDDAGRQGRGEIVQLEGALSVRLTQLSGATAHVERMVLAVAWPKGKRAAIMVEKCAELGVDRIIPTRFERSVVSKDEESEGVTRLKRIAVEAAKQSGRTTTPEITVETTLPKVIEYELSRCRAVCLDPRATTWLLDTLQELSDRKSASPVLLIVGPEGGFTSQESELLVKSGVAFARMAQHVLRVETAAIAACSITGAILDRKEEQRERNTEEDVQL
jgi:16S rRNA (uracil1498-N3)-methyltransferase